MFNSKIILITGGTGSFGKQCAFYILKDYKPKKVIIFSRDELKQYDLANEMKEKGIKNCRLEGSKSNEWKLIDGIDIIIHIFHPEKRKFYDLERMWSELIPKERLII